MRAQWTYGIAAASLIASMGLSAAANAQAADPPPPITISGTVGLVSDYRFRGVSLSDEDVAIQGGFTASTTPGFYIGTWGSSIQSYGGSEAEIDVFAGWSGEINGLKPDVGILGYIYPGGDDVNYYELYASLSYALGPANTKVGLFFGPEQDNLGGNSNVYIYGDASVGIPNSPVAVKAHLGYEKGDFLIAPDGDKLDWLVGADFTYQSLTLGVAYVDTDVGDAAGLGLTDGKVVLSLTAAF